MIIYKSIRYTLNDGRKVHIKFDATMTDGKYTTTITEEFEAENINPLEMQEQGWKMILDNFKKHVESLQ